MKVYLDNGATTRTDPEVVKEMLPYFTDKFGNASSLHMIGQESKVALEDSRRTIAKRINADKDEIIFTSGGTESNNLAIKGVAYKNEKGHIITSKIEHPSVLRTCEALEKKGFEVTYLDVDKEGFIDVEELRRVIKDDTILVSIMLANNEIGTLQDIKRIGDVCKEKNILFHTDAVQAFCKVPIDVKKTNVDLISVSGHKLHGPNGIGALYIRKGTKIKKLEDGGEQEHKLRAGTENIPGIVGFAKAVKLWKDKDNERIEELRDYLIDNIIKEVPDAILNGPRKNRLCNNINFVFEFIEGEALGGYLDAKGICSSSGSACSSHDLKPSHVLMAIGLKHEVVHGSVRLTLGRFNTKEEIDHVVKHLPNIVKKLRKMSPLLR